MTTPINLPGGNVVIPANSVLGNPNPFPAPVQAIDLQAAHALVQPNRNDGSIGATYTVDLSLAVVRTLTLTVNTTLTFINPQPGTVYVFLLKQGGIGSFLVTWPATVKWSGGTAPTLTLTAGKMDVVTLAYDGTNYYPTAAPLLNC